jgi:hypothetical protein
MRLLSRRRILKGGLEVRPRTIALAGSIAALSFAAAPVAQAATGHSKPGVETRLDRSRDARGIQHVDRSRDTRSLDRSRDIRDR